jgi:hypothetical protein
VASVILLKVIERDISVDDSASIHRKHRTSEATSGLRGMLAGQIGKPS